MGWTFSYNWQQKKDIVEHCLDFGENYKVLKHSVKGNHLWVLAQHIKDNKPGVMFIALFLLSKSQGEWGYKDLDDTCGPYYYDCPISYVKAVKESGRELSKTSSEWMEKVEQHHTIVAEKRKKSKALKPGDKVNFQGVIYQLIKKYGGRYGWEVRSMQDHGIYRMKAKQVSASELVLG